MLALLLLAVSADPEVLRWTEAAHLIWTCTAFNNDPDLRDRTTAGSREAERNQDIRRALLAVGVSENPR